jgi:hypothetical protein
MRASTIRSAVQTVVALTCAFAALPDAQAQDVRITAPAVAPLPPASPADETTRPLTPKESALLGEVLSFDPADPAGKQSARPLRLPTLSKPRKLSISGAQNPDGSSNVVVKQSLAAADWEANVGADLKTAASPAISCAPSRPFPGTADDAGSAAAWASIGVPDLASVDARLDPANDRGKLGGMLKHSVPVGKDISVTVQNTYSVTETFSPPTTTPATGLSGLPLLTAAPPATDSQGPTEVYGSEKSVKLAIGSTGTTLAAGVTTASNDPVMHDTLSADQKLFGPLHVTTAVSDIGQPVTNKSVTAGFKLNW